MKLGIMVSLIVTFFFACDVLQLSGGKVEIQVDRIVTTSNPSFNYLVEGQWDAEVVLMQVKPEDPDIEVELGRLRLAPGSGSLSFPAPLKDLRHRLKAVILSRRNSSEIPIDSTKQNYVFDILTDPNPPVISAILPPILVTSAGEIQYIVLTLNTNHTRPGALGTLEDPLGANPSVSDVLSRKNETQQEFFFNVTEWNLPSNYAGNISYTFSNLNDYSAIPAQNLSGTFSLP